MRRFFIPATALAVVLVLVVAFLPIPWNNIKLMIKGKRTITGAQAEFAVAEARARGYFDAAGVAYPPERLTLIGLKEERMLELWADDDGGRRFVHAWPVLGASGGPGPKLREGDRQVPEGFYRVSDLNPNSWFHLSLRVDYPSDEDLALAREAGIEQPGKDIFIHGSDASVGCLAMGDPAAEELFTIFTRCGLESNQVLLLPCDLRVKPAPEFPDAPAWLADRYARLRDAVSAFRR
jgi:hypothetical protein